jgi:hypothetical protein
VHPLERRRRAQALRVLDAQPQARAGERPVDQVAAQRVEALQTHRTELSASTSTCRR